MGPPWLGGDGASAGTGAEPSSSGQRRCAASSLWWAVATQLVVADRGLGDARAATELSASGQPVREGSQRLASFRPVRRQVLFQMSPDSGVGGREESPRSAGK